MTKIERYKKILQYFKKNKPIAETELNYKNAFELLISVILSAQCTDKRVNIITEHLFAKFPDAYKLSELEPNEIYDYIKTCSYPNNKSKYLSGTAKMLISDFNNTVPSEVEELIKLPGVGRKTANVIASVIFNKPVMPVDTHVFRVSNRLGLTENAKTPLETEEQLIKYIPKKLIPIAHHWFILHGRYVCKARKPKCKECEISKYCVFNNN